MPVPRFIVSIFSVGLMILGTSGVSGQTSSTGSGQAYPNKPIRLATAEPGGTSGFVSRFIADGISGPLGQPVIVDFRGNQLAAFEYVAKAAPDGYTVLVAGVSFWLGPLLRRMPYDPIKDFSPITVLASSPQILVVHPSMPVRSVKELIALAKARPGELNYASSSVGSSAHLAAALFKAMTGIDIVHVPYKGTGPAVIALYSGQVQLLFNSAAAVTPHIKSGKLRALAVTSPKPSTVYPGLPTVAATVPGYVSQSTTAMFAPAGTPAAIINRLHQEVVQVLNNPAVKEKFLNVGVEAVGNSPEELAATMKSDMASMGKVIQDAGIRAEE